VLSLNLHVGWKFIKVVEERMHIGVIERFEPAIDCAPSRGPCQQGVEKRFVDRLIEALAHHDHGRLAANVVSDNFRVLLILWKRLPNVLKDRGRPAMSVIGSANRSLDHWLHRSNGSPGRPPQSYLCRT
jgi:hypothetical protein